MPPSTYRPDIDGLRAVAVVAVMLFHLDVPALRGGFLGVDVFFVASGYLITRILLAARAPGGEGLADFYRRRVLRILPAMAVVCAASALAGVALLLPSEVTRLGASLTAAALFVANFHFLGYHGYDQALLAQLPLLHLWSLSVEEQFYLLYPLLLAAIAWRWRKRLPAVLAVMCVASLALAIALHARSPNAAFLLGPARGWELLAGGWLATVPVKSGAGGRWREALAIAGALSIAVAFTMHERVAVPHMAFLLLACAGTVGLLHAGAGGETVVGRCLSWPPLVFIGLVSYSLYLWHWPLLVLWRAVRPLQEGAALFVLPASLLLAVATWRRVEQPMRRGRWPARIVFAAGAACVLLVAVSGLVLQSNALAPRWPDEVRRIDAWNLHRDPAAAREGICFLPPGPVDAARLDRPACLTPVAGRDSWLLVGDSHAAHLWQGLAQALPGVQLHQATASGCRPVTAGGGRADCKAFMRDVFGTIARELRPQVILLAARWAGTDPQALRETVVEAMRIAPRVIVLGPAPEYREPLPRLLALAKWHGDDGLPARARIPAVSETDTALASALQGTGAIYVSLEAVLCADARSCITQTPAGVPLQFDYGHFTPEGAVLVGERLRPLLGR